MIAVESIKARAAVLKLLQSGSSETARSEWLSLAPTSAKTWDFFLQSERCAISVREKLGDFKLEDATAPEVFRIITNRARLEIQRSLSAKAQIHAVSAIAETKGWKIVVLKGGAFVANGGQIDLKDIDVLMSPESGIELSKILDHSGYDAKDPLDSDPTHHLSPRFTANDVAIEIHQSVKGIEDSETLIDKSVQSRNNKKLWRPAPAHHLWYLLIHATIQHPDRRWVVRDLYLIAHYIKECSPDDIAEVTEKINSHYHRRILSLTLRLANSFVEKTNVEDFGADIIFRKYLLLERYAKHRNLLARSLWYVCGEETKISAIKSDWKLPTIAKTDYRLLSALTKRAAWVAPLVRQSLRLARIGLVFAIASHNEWESNRLLSSHRRQYPAK